MTADEVKKAVEEIRTASWDDEAAHSAEDKLWGAVLTAIALGAPNAQELAIEAMKTADISFGRWCA